MKEMDRSKIYKNIGELITELKNMKDIEYILYKDKEMDRKLRCFNEKSSYGDLYRLVRITGPSFHLGTEFDCLSDRSFIIRKAD